MIHNRGRAVLLAMGVVLGAGTLAGCSGADPMVPAVPAEGGPHPVVLGRQVTAILDRIDAAVTSDPGDPTRVGGPYLEVLTAARKQAKALKQPAPTSAAPGRSRLVVPSGEQWPRFFLAVGEQAGQSTPQLRVLVSASARDPYVLWGELAMLPGAVLPEAAAPDRGAPTVAGDDPAGLVATPAQALTGLADVLTRGAASPDAAGYAPNAFVTQVAARQQADRAGLAKVATVTATHRADPEAVFAVRTSDGGVLVIGLLRQTVAITVKPGAGTVKVPDPRVAALAGRSAFSKKITKVAAEVVALHVPATGGGPIKVIAAHKADLSVSGS